MYFCYLDESGTPEPAGTSHFVLVGFAIPSNQWKALEGRYFLVNRGKATNQDLQGLLVQDNNETVAKKLTGMMQRFHRQGTRWTSIQQIVETPFFVDSQLTAMVQMADLCGYAIRRYYENNETDLFDRIHSRFDRTPQGIVGIHHFTNPNCACRVCKKN